MAPREVESIDDIIKEVKSKCNQKKPSETTEQGKVPVIIWQFTNLSTAKCCFRRQRVKNHYPRIKYSKFKSKWIEHRLW